MMQNKIAVFNVGSSNVKTAIFEVSKTEKISSAKHRNILEAIEWLNTQGKSDEYLCFGHRVVHGGEKYSAPVIISGETLKYLQTLIPLAPLHEPKSLEAIEKLAAIFPQIKQVACFDTSFHSTLGKLERLLPLPIKYFNEGVRRYGFHGLSYEYIASALPNIAPNIARKKIIVAHLGSGSSMCAMNNLQSVASTMGFSALEGLMMSTRTGSIDAGALLYLIEQNGFSASGITDILYKESGLKGVSGISGDMQELEANNSPEAKTAIDLYCYLAAKQMGGLITVLGGIDALVFTGGIGENSENVRNKISSYLSWLEKKPEVMVIPTNEELVIASACKKLLGL